MFLYQNIRRLLISSLLLISVSACAEESNRQENKQKIEALSVVANTQQSWQQIKQSKTIRALKMAWEEEDSLPRSGTTTLYHSELFEQFALQHQLQIQWVKVNTLDEMFDALKSHRADIIPRHLTVTQSRAQSVSFTYPIMRDNEVLVMKKGVEKPNEKDHILIDIPKSTAYIESIVQHYPNWKVNILENSLNAEEIADGLVAGQFQYSVLDGESVNTLNRYRNDISVALVLPGVKKLAWAISPNNQSFLNKLNEFISAHQVTQTTGRDRKVDLKQMKKEQLPLRIITRNSPDTYFLWRGELMGFEYELMREFAKRHQIRIEVIVANSYQKMIDLLAQGKGDIIAAGLSKIENRKSELKFSSRYNRVDELLVAHKSSPVIKDLKDLKARTLHVRQSSAFWETAQNLSRQYGVKVIAADESLATELLIAQVANKEIDLTIADSNLVSIEKRFRENIVAPLKLKESVPHGYVVRDKNPELLSALNRFIKKEYRGTFYNVIKGKYFAGQKRLKKYRKDRITAGSALSPYDKTIQQAARKYHFDWRLITAQMFQESRFDPNARSAAGALGLMQVLPKTASEMGYTDLYKPEQSIHAGVEYLNWTRARFSEELPLEESSLFALAAYNAGYGHVKDAQRLAKKLNLRADRWFNHVEKAMLLLQQPKYYTKTRFGYCRGSEPVKYVREIQQRYLKYIEIIQ